MKTCYQRHRAYGGHESQAEGRYDHWDVFAANDTISQAAFQPRDHADVISECA
jgi:hypothetical protein